MSWAMSFIRTGAPLRAIACPSLSVSIVLILPLRVLRSLPKVCWNALLAQVSSRIPLKRQLFAPQF